MYYMRQTQRLVTSRGHSSPCSRLSRLIGMTHDDYRAVVCEQQVPWRCEPLTAIDVTLGGQYGWFVMRAFGFTCENTSVRTRYQCELELDLEGSRDSESEHLVG